MSGLGPTSAIYLAIGVSATGNLKHVNVSMNMHHKHSHTMVILTKAKLNLHLNYMPH